MAWTSLPPGFRFHPTDIELVMYYLKRKILGKKLQFEAIAEVNIYKFSPWDLPDKSCLKSKDLEWFFFCPREKKYASGVRVKRATENGYWKTTGKDRHVCYRNENVGTVKTLVFHLGHAPKGERTDWVIHEYRILDNQLAPAGFQEIFVLCKVFKKSGLGPKNGAQYGAPFDEADWADDDVEDEQNHMPALPSNNEVGTMSALPEKQSSAITGMVDPGNTSELSILEALPSSAALTDEIILKESTDEMVHLLSPFKDDHTLPSNSNGNHEDGLTGDGQDMFFPSFTGNDNYNDTADPELWALVNDFSFGSGMQIDGNPLNDMLPIDNLPYLELDDLSPPLNGCAGIIASQQLSFDDIFGYPSNGNMAEDGFAGVSQYGSCVNHLPVLPETPNVQGGGSDALQMVNDQFYKGCNSSSGLNNACNEPENGQYFTQDMDGGGFNA